MKSWWMSWYTWPADGPFTLHSPWWISGSTFDGADIIVAAVQAESEEAAWEIVRQSYDFPPSAMHRRFIEDLAGKSPFGERFPRAAWMEWPEEQVR